MKIKGSFDVIGRESMTRDFAPKRAKDKSDANELESRAFILRDYE